MPLCGPIGMECFEQYEPSSEESCLKECDGMYSVVHVDTNNSTLSLNVKQGNKKLHTFFEEYLQFKRAYEPEFDDFFEPFLNKGSNNGKYTKGWPFINEQAVDVPMVVASDGKVIERGVEQRLEIIEIYFATPTFDKVTRDARTNFVTKISMIGGMLGLFTGFSIMSGIEIIYFTIRMFLKMY